MAAKSYLAAMLDGSCPRCRQGKVYAYPLQHFSKRHEMNRDCPVCGQHYEVEPGLFWGAMYVSYAFSVAISVIFGFGTFFLLNDPDVWVYLTIVISALIFFSPLSLRYSRIIMLYLFSGIKFDKKKFG